MEKIQDMVISVAEKEGWAVTIEEQNELRITFNFAKFTPQGQDFSFSANTFDNDPDVLLENNGAPYHIADIVADMNAAEDMVYQLHTALSNAFNA